MNLAELKLDERFEVELIANHRLTPESSNDDVRELTLRSAHKVFSYQAGQSIAVFAPGSPELGHETHIRLYSIANPPPAEAVTPVDITICVKRCHYIDEFSGELYSGIASNYLCDLPLGGHVQIAGPYNLLFTIPQEKDANLLLIGMGTGIAPFRAMIKHIYDNIGSWQGKIRLFYGARTGLETLYMNDERDDFANYYDKDTFAAFKALSPRPSWDSDVDMDTLMRQQGQEIWSLLCDHRTHVYLAGLGKIQQNLEKTFIAFAGDESKWAKRKAELIAGKRWFELIY